MGQLHKFKASYRRGGRQRSDSSLAVRLLPPALLALAALGAYSFGGDQGGGSGSLPTVHSYGGGKSSSTVSRSFDGGAGSCTIKGNISIGTGERIYHVPGQRYYGDTIINPLFGERWFCSEAEARAAGWRRSKV